MSGSKKYKDAQKSFNKTLKEKSGSFFKRLFGQDAKKLSESFGLTGSEADQFDAYVAEESQKKYIKERFG